ncbi:HAD-IA family hydrolase [Wenxinia marina]|uniref:Haloacid dehalogenase superfamily, subfamily IA n=1 Tax=Wenxinia marina DSM 24838 TaxID=1123501 RepID=A0A0D0Q8L5_9RHOB|nr:HAD-IA family hydrolase [Wenxinia marina]KIQ70714.1 haloacid dehalogenase superfamily, subfamily IA [Wenxinia marina DSM 24838]GGL51178.1 haloacid dehalogenase [Wenxinia marina]
MSRLRLVVFDVDGTLVDSAGGIVAAMEAAYAGVGEAPPTEAAIRSIIGFSLDVAFARLSPAIYARHRDALVDGYRAAYLGARERDGAAVGSPLYPGAAEAVVRLAADPWTLLGIATGKARRGLDAVLKEHGLLPHFTTLQTADLHPSKPDPSMLLACLAETGVAAEDAVMVGDTTIDMDMARNAGVRSVGVAWGYHPADSLRATRVIDRFDELHAALDDLWRAPA